MEKKVLTKEEITSLKDLKSRFQQLTLVLGETELQIMNLEFSKNNLKKTIGLGECTSALRQRWNQICGITIGLCYIPLSDLVLEIITIKLKKVKQKKNKRMNFNNDCSLNIAIGSLIFGVKILTIQRIRKKAKNQLKCC